MIWMDVGQNDLAHRSPFRNQIVDADCQCLLLVLIRRTGIDHQDLARVVDEITVGMGRRRSGRSSNWKANVVGMKLDATSWLATRLRQRKKSFNQIICQTRCQCLQRMQDGRHRDNFAASPLFISIAGADPLATLQFRISRHFRLLLCRTVSEKKPGVETTRRKRRCYPAAHKSEVTRVEMQTIKI